ncbi:MAG: hypothetical protein IT177_20900 [Acidobacteria bacterium]|nr:hypothetical protein [Acidobacteriota bacterium]
MNRRLALFGGLALLATSVRRANPQARAAAAQTRAEPRPGPKAAVGGTSSVCEQATLPTYKPSALPVGAQDGKADGIDGSVKPNLFGSGQAAVKSAHDKALVALTKLTSSDHAWITSYLAAEKANSAGRTTEGRLFLRLDAIDQVLAAR